MPRWPAEGIAWPRGLQRDYARSGRTVLYSSHVLPEVEQLADQVVIMHRGRLVRHGMLAELTGGRGGLEQVFLSLTAGSPRLGGGPS
jgi:ABC-2 type transport system ATP-binding protein